MWYKAGILCGLLLAILATSPRADVQCDGADDLLTTALSFGTFLAADTFTVTAYFLSTGSTFPGGTQCWNLALPGGHQPKYDHRAWRGRRRLCSRLWEWWYTSPHKSGECSLAPSRGAPQRRDPGPLCRWCFCCQWEPGHVGRCDQYFQSLRWPRRSQSRPDHGGDNLYHCP